MALFDDYQQGDIYKYIPESVQSLGRELYGGAEALTTVATAVPGQLIGIGKTGFDKVTTQPDPTMLKEEKWLEKNKTYSNNPNYKRVLKDYNFRKSQVVDSEELLGENIDKFTYMPRSKEGARNLSAIGNTLEYLKIPPFSPGVGNIGRIGYRGKTPRVKNVNSKQPTTSSETLFTRAKMYFDESKESQVDFNNSSITDLANKMEKTLSAENISKISSYGATAEALINKIKLRAKMRKPVNINELFEFRDLIDDIQTTAKPKSRFTSGLLRDELDDFITFSDEAVIHKSSAGTKQNITAFKTAQKYYGKAKNTNILEDLIIKSEMKLGANYTQAQLVDAMKKQVQTLVNSEKKSKFFTKEQKKILQDFVKGGKVENFLQRMSKLDPQYGGYGMGPTASLSIGAGMGFGDVATGLYAAAGLTTLGKSAAGARQALMENNIRKMVNKIQNREIDVKTGYRQLDFATDLGLLSLPKEKDPLKNREEEIQNLLDKTLSTVGFSQGVK
tara:strand:- start:21 stop:1529 length:1509 start_codon:yes stop_codon:yes gene_type:complete